MCLSQVKGVQKKLTWVLELLEESYPHTANQELLH